MQVSLKQQVQSSVMNQTKPTSETQPAPQESPPPARKPPAETAQNALTALLAGTGTGAAAGMVAFVGEKISPHNLASSFSKGGLVGALSSGAGTLASAAGKDRQEGTLLGGAAGAAVSMSAAVLLNGADLKSALIQGAVGALAGGTSGYVFRSLNDAP